MAFFEHGHALLVGVGADLPGTVDDAAGLAEIFKDPARCAYPPQQVLLLTAQQATRAHILDALDRLARSAGAQDTVVIYFSGHGYQVTSPTGEFYYLMPYGYDPDQLYRTAISGSEFADRLQAIRAKKRVVLLDCCHAGGVGESKAVGLTMSKSPWPPEAGRVLAEGSGQMLIASSLADELSFAGRPYSAFTLALVEALCGAGASRRDGFVRVADLALHARQVVPGRTKDRQHPYLHFQQADNSAIAYYAGGDVTPKAPPFAAPPEIEPEPGAWAQMVIQGDVSGQAVSGDHNVAVQIQEMHDGVLNIGVPEPPSDHCIHCGQRFRPGARFCSRCGRSR